MELILTALCGAAGAALVSGIFSVIMWRLNRKAAKEDKSTEKTDNLTCGVRVLLYDRIKYLGKSHLNHGYITAEDLEDLTSMHQVYHNQLGGNGFLDNVMKQVNNLPIKK